MADIGEPEKIIEAPPVPVEQPIEKPEPVPV